MNKKEKLKEGDIIVVETNSNINGVDLVVQISKLGCWNVISHKNGKPYPIYRGIRCHKLMYEKHNGEVPKGKVIRHTCDNYRCCNPEHLILGSQRDNVIDMVKRERNTQISLTNEQILSIIDQNEKTVAELCREYKVGTEVIRKIRNGTIRGGIFSEKIKGKSFKKVKLSEKEVIEIFESDLPYSMLTERYEISYATIYDIKNFRTWKRITQNFKGDKK